MDQGLVLIDQKWKLQPEQIEPTLESTIWRSIFFFSLALIFVKSDAI